MIRALRIDDTTRNDETWHRTVPGAFVIYFVRKYIAKGFALGRV